MITPLLCSYLPPVQGHAVAVGHEVLRYGAPLHSRGFATAAAGQQRRDVPPVLRSWCANPCMLRELRCIHVHKQAGRSSATASIQGCADLGQFEPSAASTRQHQPSTS